MSHMIERQREIVARHIRGENEHDWEAVYHTFVQDDRAHYDVVPLGVVFKGIDGVRGFYQTIAAALPDLKIDVMSEYDVPGCSIREVVISGTHKGEFAGVKPPWEHSAHRDGSFLYVRCGVREAHRREDLLRSGECFTADARYPSRGCGIAHCASQSKQSVTQCPERRCA